MIGNVLLEGDESPRRKQKILRFAIVVGGKPSVTNLHHPMRRDASILSLTDYGLNDKANYPRCNYDWNLMDGTSYHDIYAHKYYIRTSISHLFANPLRCCGPFAGLAVIH
jgi:hypothetical protein